MARSWRIAGAALAAASLAGGIPSAAAQEEGEAADRSADHEALVQLRVAFTEALNSGSIDGADDLVTDTFTFTTLDNRKVSGSDGLKDYWAELFAGEDAVIEKMTVAPEPDARTEFLGDDVGLVHGTSHDVFEFRTVGRREVDSRWTAVVRRVDGRWKVDCVHWSSSILDNPVLRAQASLGNLKAGIGGAAGLAAGIVLGMFVFRRKPAP